MDLSDAAGIAYCGIVCNGCPINMATVETDKDKQLKMRQEIIAITHKVYDTTLTLDQVTDCAGCRSLTGPIFAACEQCKIRQCAQDQKLSSCAECRLYPCSLLDAVFSGDPGAQHRLDVLRAAL